MFRIICLLLLAAVTSALGVERLVQKTFPVGSSSSLKLNTYRGSIIIQETDETQIKVDLRIELATQDEAVADRLMNNLDLTFNAQGDAVTINARNPTESRARFTWTDQRMDLAFRVHVPRSCNLELVTIDGDITVGNVVGNAVLKARAGTIVGRHIEGDVRATLDQGEIVISRCTGSLEASVTRGEIRVGTVFGAAKLRNSSGGIEIQSARGGVDAETAAGDVTAGFPRQLRGMSNVKADGGSILARFDPMVGCEVKASSIWGQVRTKLPFVTSHGGNSKRLLAGTLNGGGPSITLHASGGNLRLEPSTEFVE